MILKVFASLPIQLDTEILNMTYKRYYKRILTGDNCSFIFEVMTSLSSCGIFNLLHHSVAIYENKSSM